jgi:hypothetical protein
MSAEEDGSALLSSQATPSRTKASVGTERLPREQMPRRWVTSSLLGYGIIICRTGFSDGRESQETALVTIPTRRIGILIPAFVPASQNKTTAFCTTRAGISASAPAPSTQRLSPGEARFARPATELLSERDYTRLIFIPCGEPWASTLG